MFRAQRRRVVVAASSDEIESASPVGINSVPETFIRRFAFARESDERARRVRARKIILRCEVSPEKRTLTFSGSNRIRGKVNGRKRESGSNGETQSFTSSRIRMALSLSLSFFLSIYLSFSLHRGKCRISNSRREACKFRHRRNMNALDSPRKVKIVEVPRYRTSI